MVYRFQHRWETNPQFRAAMTGVLGLVVAIAMCACMGILAVVTNTALASVGAGSGGTTYSLDTGTGKLAAATAFPTYTVPPYTPGSVPAASPIPSSQTPQPTATLVPTATPLPTSTPCQTGCGGGGGGGGGGTVTASASPPTWIHGQGAAINVHTSVPNTGINIIINCPSGATVLNNGQGATDGSGNYSFPFTVPSGCGAGTAHSVIEAGFNNGASIKYADLYTPCI